ncbi:MAG: hypothetical protein UR25_C0003G0190 [Candidatus Nomurabacteria bacterium GW2011_GWE1_32_28]|uniref:Uncharacterized protein n=1 Tax=Candidatus Nomurabacteria bacterium GW2011_GWF1_31_48 TaxID=1618767 RepID=A0A0G0BH91_9BACT|nr:MAG: hypothetical protein UR10_C0003G0189 [Candidatus Nomurabacteria bacterium GW2011_GWF2_30_133]KKP28829.1 MAG: hypothetical protein UR18_C0002G0241 [Candidatus Nomurabacteria bacterium GW2011_GWE2_31_40]KKP30407.1 MAG: hypothetical protein UR19_C0003G0243 [Candidatus Nomurabacteria bacterium GW2011_GWF1_31_48]KKP34934.1 MAG: hypothetical protein UR25_C0003G0190 [Candidatus Nomurabacteria bacterium GW2011_GWE1_32_28]
MKVHKQVLEKDTKEIETKVVGAFNPKTFNKGGKKSSSMSVSSSRRPSGSHGRVITNN